MDLDYTAFAPLIIPCSIALPFTLFRRPLSYRRSPMRQHYYVAMTRSSCQVDDPLQNIDLFSSIAVARRRLPCRMARKYSPGVWTWTSMQPLLVCKTETHTLCEQCAAGTLSDTSSAHSLRREILVRWQTGGAMWTKRILHIFITVQRL